MIVRSPTRIDLAGGTLDMWPLYSFLGEARTINVAISINSNVELIKRSDKKVIINSKDLNYSKEFSDLEAFMNSLEKELTLFKPLIHFFKPTKGFELTTSSDSPVGAGLGGSSSLIISLIKAFGQMCDVKFSNIHEMVYTAHNIEAQILKTPTGTQDYYPAVTGGLSVITYKADKIEHDFLKVDLKQLQKKMLLVNSGKSHHSGINNFEVLSRAVNKDQQTLTALEEIKKISDQMYFEIKKSNWSALTELFTSEYRARIKLAKSFSSDEIEKINQISLSAGADAIKICGAGGGGCVMVWSEKEDLSLVKKELERNQFKILKADLIEPLDG